MSPAEPVYDPEAKEPPAKPKAAAKPALKPKAAAPKPAEKAAASALRAMETPEPDEHEIAEGVTVDDALVVEESGLTPEEVLRRDVERIRAKSKVAYGTLRQKLATKPIPGYSQHWFNDDPGRIEEAIELGWTHVGDGKGRPLKRIVGRGRDQSGLYAYCMKIPTEIRKEMMAELFRRAKERMAALKSSPVVAEAGSLAASDRDKFYTPREVAITR